MQPIPGVTSRQLETFRKLLIERLTALYRSVHGDLREGEMFEWDLSSGDEADESQRLQFHDLGIRLAEADALQAQKMEAALGRIARGEFGECIDCGNPIGLERLKALPWTPRCVDCQESLEAESGSRPPTM